MKREWWVGRGILAILVALTGVSAACLVWQGFDPWPVRLAGLTVDRLSAALTLLVASVGAVVFRFSLRYLDGEPGQASFLRWLGFTVGSAYVLMLASNLLLLFGAWLLTSLGLHRLLTFYGDRAEARRPARKKFLISRLGDVALVGAVALVWRNWGTLDLPTFLAAATAGGLTPAVEAVALLVVVAALTKSAQFPFHSWLPETMESPTPVSALMHAGVINAGGALLLRFAPLVVRVPSALVMLSVVGTLTAALGMVAMWAQVKVKRTLAWSTVSQMGFMMVQCGLGAFPAAALHIVGHGSYKAWSFLRTGDLPRVGAKRAPGSPARVLLTALAGILAAVPALLLASRLTGFSPWHSPGELALAAVVALAIGQVWVGLVGHRGAVWKDLGAAVLTTPVAAVGAFALYRASAWFLTPVLGDLPAPEGPAAWVAAAVPVGSLVVLTVLHALLPTLGRGAAGRAFHVHALNGFYFGAAADRLVDRVWGVPETGEVGRA